MEKIKFIKNNVEMSQIYDGIEFSLFSEDNERELVVKFNNHHEFLYYYYRNEYDEYDNEICSSSFEEFVESYDDFYDYIMEKLNELTYIRVCEDKANDIIKKVVNYVNTSEYLTEEDRKNILNRIGILGFLYSAGRGGDHIECLLKIVGAALDKEEIIEKEILGGK